MQDLEPDRERIGEALRRQERGGRTVAGGGGRARDALVCGLLNPEVMSKPSTLRNERPFKLSVNHRKESTVGERKRKADGKKSRPLPGSLDRTRQGD